MPPLGPIRLLDATLIFLVVNIGALLLCAIVARHWREAGERSRERFRERWEPVLYGRMAGDAGALPPLAPGERLMFLILWLHVLGYVRDEAAKAVVQVARDLGLSAYVLRLLGSHRDWKRVLGMQAAGILRLEEAREVLSAKISPNRPISSLVAVRALLQIDVQRGLATLQQVLRYPKWSPGTMLEIVKVAGPPATQMLGALVLSALPGRARQIVRLIVLTEDSSALAAVRERLEFSRDDQEIAALVHALGRLGGAEDRQTALKFTAHKSWLVRMQSAFALGLLGIEQDAQGLLPLLHDPVWWVRYRAAQSLLRLKGAEGLGHLRDSEADGYARVMLERVLVEAA
jgi:HEAT repeat protein